MLKGQQVYWLHYPKRWVPLCSDWYNKSKFFVPYIQVDEELLEAGTSITSFVGLFIHKNISRSFFKSRLNDVRWLRFADLPNKFYRAR